jgi:hypothetical protein
MANELFRITQPHARNGLNAELLEESSEMLAQEWMSSHTQHTHGRNIPARTRTVWRRIRLGARMPIRLRAVAAGLALISAVLACRSADAQLPIPSFGVAGGVSRFDLSGTGSAPFGALRVDIPLLSLIAEGSLGAFRPEEQNGVRRTYIIPEAQLQFQIFPIFVRPYVGVGAGWFRAISGPEPHRNDLTLSAAAGIRAGLPILPFGIRAELRLRGIGSGFAERAAEWTLGISR